MSFECPTCHKMFKREKNLHNHIHKNTVPCDFKCAKCGIKLRSKTSFLRHKKKCVIQNQKVDVHNIINLPNFTCIECGKKYLINVRKMD